MLNKIGHVTIIVKSYNAAIKFYTEKLGFQLVNDNSYGDYRWVTMAPETHNETAIVFVEADNDEKLNLVGNQMCDQVMLTIITDDCIKDYEEMKSKGVIFHGEPAERSHGTEVIFEDLYGNIFDLVEPK